MRNGFDYLSHKSDVASCCTDLVIRGITILLANSVEEDWEVPKLDLLPARNLTSYRVPTLLKYRVFFQQACILSEMGFKGDSEAQHMTLDKLKSHSASPIQVPTLTSQTVNPGQPEQPCQRSGNQPRWQAGSGLTRAGKRWTTKMVTLHLQGTVTQDMLVFYKLQV